MSGLKKIIGSSKLKSVMKISGGTMMGQLISIVSLPLITRIYGAEIMGIWATILSVALIIQSISELGLTSSLMVEEDESKLTVIYSVITTISLCISVGSVIVFFPYFYWLKGFSFINSIIYSGFGIIYAFTVKQVNTCYTWLNRDKCYDILMKNPIINYLVMSIIALLMGVLGFKKYGYFIGVTVGQIITLLHMKKNLPHILFNFKKEDHKWTINKYKKFIKYQTPNNLMFQFREQLPNLLIGSLLGDTVLGYYSVSIRILSLPVNFIGQAVGKVFYQSASELKRTGKSIGDFVYRNFNRAIIIATIPVFALFTVGDIFIVLFLGNEYVMAGTILRIVVFKTFFNFVSTSTQGLEIVLQKQKYAVISTFSQSMLSCVGIVLGYYMTHNIYISLGFMISFYIIVQVIYYQKMYEVMDIKIMPQIIEMVVIFMTIIILGSVIRLGIAQIISIFDIRLLAWFK